MPQYRIEVSPNNRAGCKDSVCKKENIKILKGEIRFGTWVEINERGSWAWKHWGCVSGQQVERMLELCGGDKDDLDTDGIDGFDEIEDKDIRDKIIRCMKQGHIDAEDFKGDPEKNVPGAIGIRLNAKELRAKAAAEAGEDDVKKPAPKKRARKSAAADDDEEDKKPAKKTKKVVKDESSDEDDKPIVKKAAAKSKPAPRAAAKKAAAKRAVKKEESDDEHEAESSFDEASVSEEELSDVTSDDDEDDFKPKARRNSQANTSRRRSGRT